MQDKFPTPKSSQIALKSVYGDSIGSCGHNRKYYREKCIIDGMDTQHARKDMRNEQIILKRVVHEKEVTASRKNVDQRTLIFQKS
jgi:hypothetical protein